MPLTINLQRDLVVIHAHAKISIKDQAARKSEWNWWTYTADCITLPANAVSENKQVSAVANWPAQQNRAVDRGWRSPVINDSGRASELEGIINLVDQWLSSLSRCERPPWSSEVDNTFRYAEAKFSKSGVSDKVQEGSTVIFVDTWISLQQSVGLVEKSHNAIIPD